jgi:hypothetical protein
MDSGPCRPQTEGPQNLQFRGTHCWLMDGMTGILASRGPLPVLLPRLSGLRNARRGKTF